MCQKQQYSYLSAYVKITSIMMKSIDQLASSFPALLLDAYGVFWGGNDVGLFPEAKATMERLVKSGKVVGILSNSTQSAQLEIDKLHKYGIQQNRHFHFFMTSGEVAKKLIQCHALPFPTPRKTFWLLGLPSLKYATHNYVFEGSNYREVDDIALADFIYLSTPQLQGLDQTDPELFRTSVIALSDRGLPMICPNPDRFAHEGNPPRAVVRQGSLAALYEETGGEVFYIGKPSRAAYEAAMQCFVDLRVVNRRDIVMIGDTPETDIRGARAFGMATALILETGIMADRIKKDGFDKALDKLPRTDQPDFLVSCFK